MTESADFSTSGGRSVRVIDVTRATFEAEVASRSYILPVVVDVAADWCEQCKQISPLLERLAAEAHGQWVLARLDVGANPEMLKVLQVPTMPVVYAMVAGKPLDGLIGAPAEPDVRQWLDFVLRFSAAALAPRDTGPGEQDGVPVVEEEFEPSQRALDAGDLDEAIAALDRLLTDQPDNPMVNVWLAGVDLARRVKTYDVDEVLEAAQNYPDDPTAQVRAADVEMAAGDIDASFDRLLSAVGRMDGADRDTVRAHLITLFEVLPADWPQVTGARARLSGLPA